MTVERSAGRSLGPREGRVGWRQTLCRIVSVGATLSCLAGPSGRARAQIVEDLYDVHFFDADRGIAVGAFGSVYATSDGGAHWELRPTPTVQHLFGVAFADAQRGVAVGRSGELLRTTDGGRHWIRVDSGTRKHLFGVAFASPRSVWIVGDWGTVLRSEDGGETWVDVSLGEDRILSAVDFADEQHGWMVGEFGTIRHTSDGGRHWELQSAGTEKTLFGVDAVSSTEAWAVGLDGLVVRTRDGGRRWEVKRGQARPERLEGIGVPQLFQNPGFYDVQMAGPIGYIVGDLGSVLATLDGGETWTPAPLPPQVRFAWIRGLAVLPDGRGVLVGSRGLILPIGGAGLRSSERAREAEDAAFSR